MWGRQVLLVIIMSVYLTGCATINTITTAESGSPILFSGTRLNINALQNNKVVLKKFKVQAPEYPLLDITPSFVADLFISPLTGPVAFYEFIFKYRKK